MLISFDSHHEVGGKLTTRRLIVLAFLAIALVGMAGAANYMYEQASIKGVGYKNVESIISTQEGFNGVKIVEKESGSGNVITEKTELEAERQLRGDGLTIGEYIDGNGYWHPSDCIFTGSGFFDATDYINFTKEAEFEYMPISYQTGIYDQKWIEKLCVQNYRIGAVLTEMHTHAEHLQKSTELTTRAYGYLAIIESGGITGYAGLWGGKYLGKTDRTYPIWGYPDHLAPLPVCGCTGVLEANLNSNVIGLAHLGWISRDPLTNSKGRHNEWGRSIEDLTGVFSIEKFIQLWGNSTCGAVSVDWLPCV